jgi:hypothetical protein
MRSISILTEDLSTTTFQVLGSNVGTQIKHAEKFRRLLAAHVRPSSIGQESMINLLGEKKGSDQTALVTILRPLSTYLDVGDRILLSIARVMKIQ